MQGSWTKFSQKVAGFSYEKVDLLISVTANTRSGAIAMGAKPLFLTSRTASNNRAQRHCSKATSTKNRGNSSSVLSYPEDSGLLLLGVENTEDLIVGSVFVNRFWRSIS